jgi:hypothetical protein
LLFFKDTSAEGGKTMMLESGKSGIAFSIAGYGTAAGWVAIGSGSGVVTVNNTGLVYEVDRNAITGSPDISVLKQISYTADFNSVEMSGIGLKEFGLFNLSSGGQAFVREGFASVSFDGTNELQILIKLDVF